MVKKYLDTYALVEIHNQNNKFKDYLEEDCTVTDSTMMEFYYLLYKRHDRKTADYWYKKFSFMCEKANSESLLKAARFRYDNKNKNYSFFDAIGYVHAQENNMDFVTGDKEFKDVEGVEFVK